MFWFLKILATPLFRIYLKTWCKGKENIPKKPKGAIIAAHHTSALDSVVVPLLSTRKIYYIGKLEYFNRTGLSGKLKAVFFRSVGVYPVDQKGSNSQDAIQRGIKTINKGHLFGIYPEGTRSYDGKVHRGKTGIARIALNTGAPIIPVAIFGANQSLPIGKSFPKSYKCGVIFGEQIDTKPYIERDAKIPASDMDAKNELLHEITDKVMHEIATISKLEYVNEYIDRENRQQSIKKKSGRGKEEGINGKNF